MFGLIGAISPTLPGSTFAQKTQTYSDHVSFITLFLFEWTSALKEPMITELNFFVVLLGDSWVHHFRPFLKDGHAAWTARLPDRFPFCLFCSSHLGNAWSMERKQFCLRQLEKLPWCISCCVLLAEGWAWTAQINRIHVKTGMPTRMKSGSIFCSGMPEGSGKTDTEQALLQVSSPTPCLPPAPFYGAWMVILSWSQHLSLCWDLMSKRNRCRTLELALTSDALSWFRNEYPFSHGIALISSLQEFQSVSSGTWAWHTGQWLSLARPKL